MKTIITLCFSVIAFSSFAQRLNLVIVESIRANLRAEAGVVSDVLNPDNQPVLKVASSMSTGTPAFYMASCKVREGTEYTYVVNAGPNSAGKVALYITSPAGNIGWPGTVIKEGQVTQTFMVPAGADQVTLAIAFLQPQEGDSVYIKTIGLFEGTAAPYNWQADKANAMNAFLIEAVQMKEAKAKELEEGNLVTVSDLTEIKIEQDLQISIEQSQEKGFLKVTRAPTTHTPAVYFRTLSVLPGQTYTYFVSLTTSARINAYVTMPSGNLIWPGVELKNGINKQLVTVPDGVTEITIGLAFSAPGEDQGQQALIENIGFYKGDIDPSLWSPGAGGLRNLYQTSNTLWMWVLLPIAIIILIALYIRSRRKKGSPEHSG